MTPSAILALIAAQITSNGVGGITGPILNNILTQIVNLFATSTPAAQIVTSSATLTLLNTNFRVGLQRNINVSAMNVLLPSSAGIGQEFVIQDLTGNFQAFPATVAPPGGHTIAGLGSYTMNVNRQTKRFAYYGSNVWGVE